MVLRILILGLLSSSCFAARKATLGSVPFLLTFRPGPSLDASGYDLGGDWANNTDGVSADTQYVGRTFNLLLTNQGTQAQTVVVSVTGSGISWACPEHRQVGLKLGGQGASKEDKKFSPNVLSVTSDSFTIAAGGTERVEVLLEFYGPTKYLGSYFTARANLTFAVSINEDRGAVIASIASNGRFSIAGKKGPLTSKDSLEDAMLASNFSHTTIQLNGGRAF